MVLHPKPDTLRAYDTCLFRSSLFFVPFYRMFLGVYVCRQQVYQEFLFMFPDLCCFLLLKKDNFIVNYCVYKIFSTYNCSVSDY
jgi:hypothetical protein